MNTQYQLCFYSGSLTGKIYPIVKEETKIGRDASCDIVLTENSVSRIHVFLYVQQNGSVVLVDNNSTNGTVVNNNQISAPVQLSENDVIGLGGEVMLVFQKVAGFDPGSQWKSTDMPAGNAPDSYNFEKKQGNPMNNEVNNNNSDGAMNGFVPQSGQDQQPTADGYGFNQAYNNYAMPGMNQVQPAPYGYNMPNPNDAGYNAQMPMQNTMHQPDNFSSGMTGNNDPVSAAPAGIDAVQNPISGASVADPASQQMMGQPMQNPYGANPYSQQQPMMAQQPQMPYGYGTNPYGQQPMMGQQNGFSNDPYAQQMGQQPMMGQQGQMPYGNDPYAQQMMGQQGQMPYGNDPYAQQMMGQQAQIPYGNDPYSQQMMGQQGQMPYGNDPYSQQMMGQQGQMPYGNNPYGQQMMGQQAQMPYGNNPYAQQQYQGQVQSQTEESEKPKKKKKKTIITLGVILGVLLLIGLFIFYIDHNRLWCDVFPFLWDADTCANYVR